jgi:molybdenum cofactor cytidylyltransferase
MRRGLFGAVMGLSGDHGARAVLKAHLAQVVEVPIDDPAILLDLDTPEALALARQSGSARLTP